MYIQSGPVVEVELEDIDIAIRKERAHIWKLEDEQVGPDWVEASDHWLKHLQAEKARGVTSIVTNF